MTLLAESRLSFVTGAPSRALRHLAPSAFVTDVLAVALAGLGAAVGRDRLGVFDPGLTVADTLGLAGPLMVGGWLLALWLVGSYSRDVFGVGTDEYKRVLNASVLAAGLVGVGAYLAKFPLSRGFFLLLFAIGIPALITGRFLLRRAPYAVRIHGALRQRVVIAGTPSHVAEAAGVLRRGRRARLGEPAAPDRVVARGPRRPGRGGTERHRCLGRAGQGPPGRRPAADAHRQAARGARLPGRQAPLRRGRLRRAAAAVRSPSSWSRRSGSSCTTAARSCSPRTGPAATGRRSAA
jgi:hypothetical protein